MKARGSTREVRKGIREVRNKGRRIKEDLS